MIKTAYIIYATSFVFFMLFLLYCYLVWRKRKNLRFTAKKEAWIEAKTPYIKEYLIHGTGETSFIPRQEHEYVALEDFFASYLSNYKKNDEEHDPVREFVVRHFVQRYRNKLRSKQWSARLNTLHFIDLFQIQQLQPDLLRLLRQSYCTAEEKYQIYVLLGEFQFSYLEELFTKSRGETLPPFLLNEMMERLVDFDNFDSYVEMFDTLPAPWQLAILDIARNENYRTEKFQALLERILADDSSGLELRIRALKAISELGYISSWSLLESVVVDALERRGTLPVERLMAARVIGQLRQPQFAPYLRRLIRDREYIVRAEAAKSIAQYRNGYQLLAQIAERDEDRYARDIAREWLERKEMFHGLG